ncbi:hypothetical protein [Sandaracinus amylolyticus]|uniref:hypothetical protein n=1 Tax=Sandaracinus amylolyticus TaxID=927083 RepID=UPI001F1FE091|nr:hypothetical protein [Sandaracinus amylolyticus]UJR80573.1 Hypothetical protein I5071_26200 [Sandaracinus amylolyticus]
MGSLRWAGARIALAALSIVVAATVFQPRARATVMVEVPLEAMVRDADAIVVGVVENVGARLVMSPSGGAEPHTITTLRVREWVKGSGGELVRIDELGGETDIVSTRIAGTPEYTRGDEVVVFLRRTPDGALRTYAMVQGRFSILRGFAGADDVVVRDTTSVGFATWASGPMAIEHGGVRAMRLDDFLAYVRATLEQIENDPTTGRALGGGAR